MKYYSDDGEPLKCFHCRSTQMENVNKAYVESIVCQYKIICSDCKKDIGYWSTGNFDPSYAKHVALIQDFQREIIEVCKKHKLSISHEDGQGGFLIENYNPRYTKWFLAANDETTEPCPFERYKR